VPCIAGSWKYPGLSILTARTKDEVLQNEGAVLRESNPRAALYSCESMWIYLIQVKKKMLESDSQLSDASIKMSTRILLNGFSESRGRIRTIELSTCSEWWIVNFFFARLTSRSDSWLAFTTVFVRLRYLQASRREFLFWFISCAK